MQEYRCRCSLSQKGTGPLSAAKGLNRVSPLTSPGARSGRASLGSTIRMSLRRDSDFALASERVLGRAESRAKYLCPSRSAKRAAAPY
jgi:hypothetical protein